MPIFLPLISPFFREFDLLSSWPYFEEFYLFLLTYDVLHVRIWETLIPVHILHVVVSVRVILLGDYFAGIHLIVVGFPTQIDEATCIEALKCFGGGSPWLMWFCVGDEARCNGSSPLLSWPHVTWPCSESWNQGPDPHSWLPDYFKSSRPSACNYSLSVIG